MARQVREARGAVAISGSYNEPSMTRLARPCTKAQAATDAASSTAASGSPSLLASVDLKGSNEARFACATSGRRTAILQPDTEHQPIALRLAQGEEDVVEAEGHQLVGSWRHIGERMRLGRLKSLESFLRERSQQRFLAVEMVVGRRL